MLWIRVDNILYTRWYLDDSIDVEILRNIQKKNKYIKVYSLLSSTEDTFFLF